jgi:hypothetical protein
MTGLMRSWLDHGFGQTIKGNPAVTKKPVESVLPHATYTAESVLDTTTLRDALAKLITQRIQPNIVMLVARFDEWETYIS